MDDALSGVRCLHSSNERSNQPGAKGGNCRHILMAWIADGLAPVCPITVIKGCLIHPDSITRQDEHEEHLEASHNRVIRRALPGDKLTRFMWVSDKEPAGEPDAGRSEA